MKTETQPNTSLPRLFLALAPLAYLMSTISLTIHEFGHIWASRLFGSVANSLYIAPGVFGYASFRIAEDISRGQRNLITFGGSSVEIVFGFASFLLAYLLAKRSCHWFIGVMGLGGLLSVGFGGGYLLISPFVKWGDGYALLNNGIPAYAFIIFGLILGVGLFFLAPVAIRFFSDYFSLASLSSVWFILMVFMLIPQLYALLKAALFFPDHVTRKFIYAGVIFVFSVIFAYITYRFSLKSGEQRKPPSRQIKDITIILLWLLAFFVEVGYTYLFGLQGEMLPIFS